MRQILPILSISGSDSTGGAGIQGDIKTIAALGGYAVTVLTTVALQNHQGILSMNNLPVEVVSDQLEIIMNDIIPKAIKIGLLGNGQSASVIARRLSGCGNIVYAPGFESTNGDIVKTDGKLSGEGLSILAITRILVMKVSEVEILLGESIVSIDEIIQAARRLQRFGPRNVLILGGHSSAGLISNILLCENNAVKHFSLNDTDNWKAHGLCATLSAAIATLLGKGFGIEEAVNSAHEYVRSLVLYSVELRDGMTAKLIHRSSTIKITERQAEIYNSLMQLVASNFRKQHDVMFYANQLCVTDRYLAQITRHIAGKSPKRLIDEYIVQEAEREIVNTSKTIQIISYEFGFSSQSQFSKFFKNYKGFSPIDMRS